MRVYWYSPKDYGIAVQKLPCWRHENGRGCSFRKGSLRHVLISKARLSLARFPDLVVLVLRQSLFCSKFTSELAIRKHHLRHPLRLLEFCQHILIPFHPTILLRKAANPATWKTLQARWLRKRRNSFWTCGIWSSKK